MKKWLFIFGTFSLMLISLSALFKVQHWQGASLLLVFGVVIMALVLIAAAIRHRSLIIYVAAVSLAFLLLSMGFRIAHLPGTRILMTTGALIFSLVLLPLLGWQLYQQSKQQEDK